MQWLEAAKTMFIGILILLAVLLTAIISSYGGTEAFLGTLQTGPMDAIPISTDRTLTDGAQPVLISVKSQQGRATFAQDFGLLDSAYEALGSFLAQALDTAESPVELGYDNFYETVATGNGIYFRYPAAVSLPILALWLDGESAVDLKAQGYFLQVEDDVVRLFVEGAGYYSMLTQVDGEALQHALEGYAPDGTSFALEQGKENLYPMTVLSTGENRVLAGTVANPCDGNYMLELASALLFNPYGESKYMDQMGATVFTESDCTLRVGTDGQLTLENLEGTSRFTATSGAPVDQIDYLTSLLTLVFQDTVGEDRVMYTGYEVVGELNHIYFDYYLQGIPVIDGANHSIQAVFRGNTLLSLEVHVRRYQTTADTYLTYLPVEQAAALVPAGQPMVLAYGDLTGQDLTVGWIG